MTSVLTEIIQWAAGKLKFWEQAALDKIISGEEIDEETYVQLLQYLLEDAGLVEPVGARPKLKIFSAEFSITQSPVEGIKLTKILNIQNVDALVADQELTFSPALTAIYGGNASGKSGYARVFGCAGFSRGDKHLLPNVTEPISSVILPSADIEICLKNGKPKVFKEVRGHCPELISFHVFDATSVKVHLLGSNSFSFSPVGLNYLTYLAEVTDKVRGQLRELCNEYEKPHNFNAYFHGGETSITELVGQLGPITNIKNLLSLAKLNQDEIDSIEELDKRISELKAQNIPYEIDKLSRKISDLELLSERLFKISSLLGAGLDAKISYALYAYQKTDLEAKKLSIDQFKTKNFTQVGSDLWHQFIKAAKDLADTEGTPDIPYPQPGDHCLLCHQLLSDEAYQLLINLWNFLEGEAQEKLSLARRILDDMKLTLEKISLDFFTDQSVSYRHLEEQNKDLFNKVNNFIRDCRMRSQIALKSIDNKTSGFLPSINDNCLSDIVNMVKELKEKLDDLKNRNPEKEIAGLEQKVLTLKHRETLNNNLPDILDYVKKRKWAKRARQVTGTTRDITLKHNELFRELVEKGYVDLFANNLKKLGHQIPIKVETEPRKGDTYRRIVLDSHASITVEGITLERVLSDGEKHAVALADFLTEVQLNPSNTGIILDDPVTSFDLDWKETIALILVKEAKHRQVIIFTHDLPFLYHIHKHAEEEGVEIVSNWIKRGDNDNKPGYVYLDNSPALEKTFKNTGKVRKIYESAMYKGPEEQERLIKQGLGMLRSCYEAFIIFDLFGGVVQRFEERVTYSKLRYVVWDETIIQEVIEKYEYLSSYIEAHLHSDLYCAKKPTLDLLLKEIEAFDSLKAKHKNLKKQSGKI